MKSSRKLAPESVSFCLVLILTFVLGSSCQERRGSNLRYARFYHNLTSCYWHFVDLTSSLKMPFGG